MNIILLSDSYKYSHRLQYPKGVSYMHSYLESRGSDGVNTLVPKTMFYGLQYYLKQYLSVKVTKDMVLEAKEMIEAHGLYFDYDGWMTIVDRYDGKLPLKIRAVKEGSLVDRNNVLMTIESTDPELFWLVGWAETLLMKVWYPTTVATLSYNINQLIKGFMVETCDSLDKLPFMLHDFGYRGVSSEESAALGGSAHLLNFLGTDNIASLVFSKKYYHNDMAGFSIPASEHSTITSWGAGQANEKEAFKNMFDSFGGKYPLIACVSDSFDFSKALDTWEELKDDIIASGSTLVIRPDSGDSRTNILLALRKLEESFGVTVNTKGYKVLNNVALIQGDGVDFNAIYDILKMMQDHGFSADNIAFGMGGALLQGNQKSSMNRDTHRFAIKCSAIMQDDKLVDVYKDPITDQGKKSKKGRLDLIIEEGQYKTIKLEHSEYNIDEYHQDSVLQTYYLNGEALVDATLDEIRSEAKK